jgi:hypothetical protein
MSECVYLGETDTRRIEALTFAIEQLTETMKEPKNVNEVCLQCMHVDVCYYYKHSGGGCLGKFTPLNSKNNKFI